MRRSLNKVTLAQARALAAFAPGRWTLSQLPTGKWSVQRDGCPLITDRGTRRAFASLDTAVRFLKEDLGATAIVVETLAPTVNVTETAAA